MQIRSVGIDLGKTTFHLVALGDNGKVLLKKKFTQKQLIAFTANIHIDPFHVCMFRCRKDGYFHMYITLNANIIVDRVLRSQSSLAKGPHRPRYRRSRDTTH
jgi:hypothetical protein